MFCKVSHKLMCRVYGNLVHILIIYVYGTVFGWMLFHVFHVNTCSGLTSHFLKLWFCLARIFLCTKVLMCLSQRCVTNRYISPWIIKLKLYCILRINLHTIQCNYSLTTPLNCQSTYDIVSYSCPQCQPIFVLNWIIREVTGGNVVCIQNEYKLRSDKYNSIFCWNST